MNTGNGQNLRYTLVPNRYKFKLTENGLGLFSTLDQPGVAGTAAPSTSSLPSADSAPLQFQYRGTEASASLPGTHRLRPQRRSDHNCVMSGEPIGQIESRECASFSTGGDEK